MKNLDQLKKILHKHKNTLMMEYGIDTLGLFGSYVIGEQKENSDLDILVEFRKATDLLTFVHLKNYLSDLLDLNVDLVMKKSLKPTIGKKILQQVLYI